MFYLISFCLFFSIKKKKKNFFQPVHSRVFQSCKWNKKYQNSYNRITLGGRFLRIQGNEIKPIAILLHCGDFLELD